MARPLRIEYDGAVYHITSRGNERKNIFKDDEARSLFLDTLKKVNEKHNWLCHAYCLMNNHYHLVIETPDGNLSKGMRQLNGVYTQAFNKRHDRVGHIFQGRYKAILVSKESHLLETCRYVVLNPVRAKATGTPGEWKWSSYRGTVGFEKPHPCLTIDWILGQFSTKRGFAIKKYREFVKAGIGESTIWTSVKGQIILGKEDFIEKFMDHVRKHEEIREIPRSQRYVGRPALAQLFKVVTIKNKLKRNKMIREAVIRYGYTQNEISNHLGMHYSTISRLLKDES
ncbi:MAG: transposase [Nitrospirae bacterium]|nr:transposase [Nitrospirota bacterium]